MWLTSCIVLTADAAGNITGRTVREQGINQLPLFYRLWHFSSS
jgi:hypothetical protein